ncbi:MAG: hypothetical protein M0036_18505 [Desulfobacteraceae bacterium]|nr:hypothetical protein [Desulfobacteraceae bacterium]
MTYSTETCGVTDPPPPPEELLLDPPLHPPELELELELVELELEPPSQPKPIKARLIANKPKIIQHFFFMRFPPFLCVSPGFLGNICNSKDDRLGRA